MKRYVPVLHTRVSGQCRVYGKSGRTLKHGDKVNFEGAHGELSLWMDEDTHAVCIGLMDQGGVDYVVPPQLLAGPVRLDKSRQVLVITPTGKSAIEFSFEETLKAVKSGERTYSKEQRDELVGLGYITEDEAKTLDYAQRAAKKLATEKAKKNEG